MKETLSMEDREWAIATKQPFPLGQLVYFKGYDDEIGKKTATFSQGDLLEVVGHSQDCGADGLMVRQHYRGGSNSRGQTIGLVFATEVEICTTLYNIVRIYRPDLDRFPRVIKCRVTLEEAQAHCGRPETQGEGWFDGYLSVLK